MRTTLNRFLLGIGDRLALISLPKSRRFPCRLGAAAIVFAILQMPAWCQLALPEFFGFYAVDGGRTAALVDGKDSVGITKATPDLYSIPRKASQPYTVPEVSHSARFLLFYQNSGEMIKVMALHRFLSSGMS